MPTRTRTRHGQAERDIITAEQDAQAAHLRAQGLGYRAIAHQLGIGVGTAHAAVARAIAAVPVEAVAELRAVELTRLDAAVEAAVKVLKASHPYVSQGRVFPDIEDAAPILGAIRELRSLSESRRKLLGLDAPSRQTVTVITEDAVDAALREAAEEHARLTNPDPVGSTSRET